MATFRTLVLFPLLCSLGACGDLNSTKVDDAAASGGEFELSFERITNGLILSFDRENVSAECKSSARSFEKSLQRLELWALQMFDSSAKLPSGVLNGNINQYGDFDQCLQARTPNSSDLAQFSGKYCIAQIMVDFHENREFFEFLRHRALAMVGFVSDFDDFQHLIPRSSEFKFAFCVPSTCASEDVRVAVDGSINEIFEELPMSFRVQVNETMCQVASEAKAIRFGDKIAIACFAILATLLVLSTVADHLSDSQGPWLTAFSLKRNFKELTSLEPSSGDIASMHCIRAIVSLLLLIAHKSLEQNFNPTAGKYQMNEFLLQPFNLVFRAAYLHTDIFLLFSGFLVANSLLKRLHSGRKIDLFREIFGRYLRLMPPVGALIIFSAAVAPHLGSGPLWPMLVDYQAQLCKRNWPRSVLMAQNFLGFENICMMHTHHVATDFQLFLVAPIAVGLLWSHGKVAIVGLAAVGLASTAGRFFVIFNSGLSVFATAGSRIKDLIEVSNVMYILPYYRITVYLIGIWLAFELRKQNKRKLSDAQLTRGWTIAIASSVATVVVCRACEHETRLVAALYASVASISVCIPVAWIIFTSELGHRNFLSPLMEWRRWKLLSNLSYAIYLVQFPVFHHNIGKVRASAPFSVFGTVIDLHELSMIFVAAVLLTICVDYPFKNLKFLLFDRTSRKVAAKVS